MSINYRNQNMKATAKDLRFHAREILETVMRGEEVLITFRGKPSAKIVPLHKKDSDKEDHHKLFGIWTDYNQTKDVNAYVRKIREGRVHDN
jgi:prevent-host-death family protein